VGIAGLSPIQWENGLAEISLVLNPEFVGKGYGEEAFALLLEEAFNNMRLEQVVVESYCTNPALGFWEEQAAKYGAYRTILPKRKYWNGAYHDAIYFSFSARRDGEKV
jgi:RimJ/RimL family protein N-acetyltransferase